MKSYYRYLLLPLLCVNDALADYGDNANQAISQLQQSYNTGTGLWKGADGDLWWQSGNMVETIARFGIHDSSFKSAAADIVANTYEKSPNQRGANNWKNDYYDDMGWWALGWIASFDLTGEEKYLNTAKDLFDDMVTGWGTSCGGGVWWDKRKTSIAAIANELFISVAAHLANRVGAGEKDQYQQHAQEAWDWFWLSGVINADNVVNDGIDPSTCKNDGKTTYTYNQGIILGGLSELAKAKGDGGLIQHANTIANGALAKLTQNGILVEPVSGPLDEQGAQFKGAFVRGLASLNGNERQQAFTDFLKKNADSAWDKAKNANGIIGSDWRGPADNAGTTSHASGIDVLSAAAQAG